MKLHKGFVTFERLPGPRRSWDCRLQRGAAACSSKDHFDDAENVNERFTLRVLLLLGDPDAPPPFMGTDGVQVVRVESVDDLCTWLSAHQADAVLISANTIDELRILSAFRKRDSHTPAIVVANAITREMSAGAFHLGADELMTSDQVASAELTEYLQRSITRRASEVKIHALAWQSGGALLLVNETGSVLQANPAATRLLGPGPADLPMGGSGRDTSAQDKSGDLRLRGANGEILTAHAQFFPTEHLDQPAFLVTLSEIHNTTKLQAIKPKNGSAKVNGEDEPRYRELADDAPDVIFRLTLNPTLRVEYINNAVRQVTGHDSTDFYNDPHLLWRLVHPDDRRPLAELLQGDETRPFEVRLFAADGTIRWVSCNAVATRGPKGGLVALQGIARDVTVHRETEAALERTQEQLIWSQKMEAVGRLAGGIAHDFNNLLTAIVGFGNFVLEEMDESSAAWRDMNEVMRAADRAEKLTAQLLTFSRRKAVAPRVTNINDSLTELDRMLKRILGEDIDLIVDLASDLWNVNVDPGALEQVIMNLAINARDAMPLGGWLRVETTNLTLDKDVTDFRNAIATAGEYVRIIVADNGHGMDDETLTRIFEPFFTTKGLGTGLGLSTCYSIVRQAGGFIRVNTGVANGTTFSIYLPRDSRAVLTDARAGSEVPMGGSETVLIVEDEDQVRGIAMRTLERLGYRVLAATDGSVALALSEEFDEDIDLLVTDVVMPHLGGRSLARSLTAARPTMRVLFMSGYAEEVMVQRGLIDAGVELLPKPFTPEALAQRVRKVLDQSGSLKKTVTGATHI